VAPINSEKKLEMNLKGILFFFFTIIWDEVLGIDPNPLLEKQCIMASHLNEYDHFLKKTVIIVSLFFI
jgi:hypothetical protein